MKLSWPVIVFLLLLATILVAPDTFARSKKKSYGVTFQYIAGTNFKDQESDTINHEYNVTLSYQLKKRLSLAVYTGFYFSTISGEILASDDRESGYYMIDPEVSLSKYKKFKFFKRTNFSFSATNIFGLSEESRLHGNHNTTILSTSARFSPRGFKKISFSNSLSGAYYFNDYTIYPDTDVSVVTHWFKVKSSARFKINGRWGVSLALSGKRKTSYDGSQQDAISKQATVTYSYKRLSLFAAISDWFDLNSHAKVWDNLRASQTFSGGISYAF